MDLEHAARVRKQLEDIGVGYWGLTSPEAHYLPHVIHRDEQIEGAVYGKARAGSVLLVATDRRIIYLDRKPLFTNEEEIAYDVIGGVSHSHSGIGTSLTLSTRIKNYHIKTYNERCASGFVAAIERRCVENLNHERGDRNDYYY
jgi:hypothetical protein